MVIKYKCESESPPDSIGPEWGYKICISNMSASDTVAAGLDITLWEPLDLAKLWCNICPSDLEVILLIIVQ